MYFFCYGGEFRVHWLVCSFVNLHELNSTCDGSFYIVITMLWVRDKQKECKRERVQHVASGFLTSSGGLVITARDSFLSLSNVFHMCVSYVTTTSFISLSLCIAVILNLDTTPSLFSPPPKHHQDIKSIEKY